MKFLGEARRLHAICVSDSNVHIPLEEIVAAFIADGGIPEGAVEGGWDGEGEDEMELLVTGGDEGEAPEELVQSYPNLHALITKYFS